MRNMMSVSRFDSETVLFYDYVIATAFKYRHAWPTFLPLKGSPSNGCQEGITMEAQYHVLAEHGGGIDGINAKRFALTKKRCASLEAGQVFNGVVVDWGKRKVHNLLKFSAKLWTTLWGARKDAISDK